jgi:SAM-dependent methyltransferase
VSGDLAAGVPPVLPPVPPAVAATLLALAGVRTGDTVVDAGCGAGLLTYAAAAGAGPSGRVYGVDASAALLGVARARRSSAVVWVRAAADRLPFAGSSVDRLLAGPGAPPDAVLAEWRRVLAGRLATCGWGPFAPSPAEAAVLAAAAEVLGADVAEPGGGGLAERAGDAGLRVVHSSVDEVAVPFATAAAYAAWRLSFPVAAAALAAAGAGAFDAVVERVAGALGDGPVHSESVIHYLAATAR